MRSSLLFSFFCTFAPCLARPVALAWLCLAWPGLAWPGLPAALICLLFPTLLFQILLRPIWDKALHVVAQARVLISFFILIYYRYYSPAAGSRPLSPFPPLLGPSMPIPAIGAWVRPGGMDVPLRNDMTR
jgi:hypothetical protein